jgi:zinc transporter, ZIP family
VTTLDPLATVLLFSTLASLAAVVGALPQAVGGRPSPSMIGWANALAAGLMIGVAYILLTEGLQEELSAGGIGAVLGIGFVRATHALTGTGELDADRIDEESPAYGYQAILVETLHAAHEGVAIGVAMAVSLPLGVAMAVTLAVHNIPESVTLNAVLTQRGVSLHLSALLSVAVNLNQVLLAVLTFAVVGLWPFLLPWVTGFAVGTLLYLTLVELLPESYRQAGHTSIALVTLVAMGVVVLLAGVAT